MIFFPLKPELIEDQKKVLNTGPNLIITGAAGTGKTFLTILIAEDLRSKFSSASIAIIILTISLKRFINAALKEKGIQSVQVFYHHEFNILKKFDFIIVDEAQDFSLNQLRQLKESSNNGIYFLGDSNQRIYDDNYKERTATMEEVKKEFPIFNTIELKINLRFNEGIKNFICDAFPYIQMLKGNNSEITKPKILYFETEKEEIKEIQELLRKDQKKGDVGIFCQENCDVIKTFLDLKEKGFDNIGYKGKFDNRNIENLCFSENSINILTYHSAKGLEFDSVYLPFLNTAVFKKEIASNLFYVGLTRARKKLILSYSGNFTSSLKFTNSALYDGIIKRPYLVEEVENAFKETNIVIEEIKKRYNEIGFNDNKLIEQRVNEIKEKSKSEIPVLKEKLKEAGLTLNEIEEFLKNRL